MARSCLSGLLLASTSMVAGEAGTPVARQNQASEQTRRPASPSRSASVTEAGSALAAPSSPAVTANALPPLPAGVTDLRFSEFFRQPVGPRGLDYTDKLRALAGRRVRVLGFMARQERPVDHCFLLAPLPLTLHEAEYGLADDLPATALHVFTTKDAPARTPFTPGPLLLTGTLSLGNRVEADGRTSTVRLHLDPPTKEQKEAAHHAAQSAAGQDAHAGHAH